MPKKRRYGIRHRPARVVLSEMLPYEVPVHFSNVGLYRFLNESAFKIENDKATFRSDDPALLLALRIMFGKDAPLDQVSDATGTTYSIPLKVLEKPTVPLQYRIRHRADQYRQLTIPHPASQIAFVAFYEKYKGLLLYHTSGSEFSVRRPFRLTRYTVIRDSVFRELQSTSPGTVEVHDREYDQLRSFFVYRKYDNVQKFYESADYRESEKRFGHLMRLDISKCFDSVYTHSLGWAISDKEAVKREFNEHKTTFADTFDRLIRAMNDNETHGIVIGPEVSRIFAEIVLQKVDRDVAASLEKVGIFHGRDYEVLRYVDDYFIFMRTPEMKAIFSRQLDLQLRPFKLFLNDAKEEVVTTPFMSDMSIAKERIGRSLRSEVALDVDDFQPDVPGAVASFASSTRQLLSSYKTTLRVTNLGPLDLVNYTLATLERRVEECIETFDLAQKAAAAAPDETPRRRLLAANRIAMTHLFLAVIDFAFYVYGGSPRVGPAIKLARVVSLCRKACATFEFGTDNRNSVDDLIYSEILVQINRNPLDENASVEGLYLLTILGELGDSYRLDPTVLYRFAGVVGGPGKLAIPRWHNALTISAIVQFIRNDPEYQAFKSAIETWIVDRVEELEGYGRPVTERTVLTLDTLTSPYISPATKRLLGEGYMPHGAAIPIAELHDRWFVNWAPSDLYGELRNKRVQEVY